MSQGRALRRLAVALVAAALVGCTDADPAPEPETEVAAIMSGPAQEGFARAMRPRRLVFPRDHGAHPAFQSEWWYFTGSLSDPSGQDFGFQLTLFRFALSPPPSREVAARASRFAARHVWMGHFAVTDVAGRRFHGFERFARGAAGLAGARIEPFAVWVEDWQATGASGADPFPMRLHAVRGQVAIDLTLSGGHPRVLQGDRGLSQKSAEPGNASYYYSYPRLRAEGIVSVPRGRFTVNGSAWMDREWSTSALAEDQAGWDWFALHLDDGRNLMFYRLRDTEGGMHPFSKGMISGARGLEHHLGAEDVRLDILDVWRSPAGGAYPVSWRLRTGNLDLRIDARLDDQEHRSGFRYWEGAVAVRGREGSSAVAGRGYLEMTGY